jgi:neutral ceramidase
LVLKDIDDNWLSVLGNYGLHYAADWEPDTVTADYFGEFSKQIRNYLSADEDFVGMMSNGTSGDVNIWDFLEPDRLPNGNFEKTSLIGKTIAMRVSEKLKHIPWVEKLELSVATDTIEVKVRKPNAEELERAKRDFISKEFNDLGTKADFIQRIYNREQVLLNEYPDTVKLFVQVIKIGNLIIGAIPGEAFAETGLKLKEANCEVDYFSINLSNSYGGYIPPAHEFELGGYETWRARSSCMDIKTEEIIRNKIQELITKL